MSQLFLKVKIPVGFFSCRGNSSGELNCRPSERQTDEKCNSDSSLHQFGFPPLILSELSRKAFSCYFFNVLIYQDAESIDVIAPKKS